MCMVQAPSVSWKESNRIGGQTNYVRIQIHIDCAQSCSCCRSIILFEIYLYAMSRWRNIICVRAILVLAPKDRYSLSDLFAVIFWTASKTSKLPHSCHILCSNDEPNTRLSIGSIFMSRQILFVFMYVLTQSQIPLILVRLYQYYACLVGTFELQLCYLFIDIKQLICCSFFCVI